MQNWTCAQNKLIGFGAKEQDGREAVASRSISL